MKLQKSVLREVRHIAIGTVACAAVQLAVFALLGRLDGTVWLGTAVGAGFAVFNFVLLGFTMQRAAAMPKRPSRSPGFPTRCGCSSPVWLPFWGFQLGALNGVATALALFFPRITISVMQLLGFYKPQPKEAPAA